MTSHPFVLSHESDLLDILCTRYPGTRPSAFYGDLDEYQAFQFDTAMAFKGYLRDRERDNEQTHTLLQGMRGIMMSNGAKPKKLPRPQKLIKPPIEEQQKALSLTNVLQALGGDGVVVEESKNNG